MNPPAVTSAFARSVLATVLAFSLAACGASGGTPSAPPTSGGPPMPTPAYEQSRAGALSFAQHYVDTFNYAQATGDLNGLVPLEALWCYTCQAFRHAVSGVYDAGGTLTGGTWRVTGAAATPNRSIDGWDVTNELTISAQHIHHGDGAAAERVPSHPAHLSLQLSWRTGEWEVLKCVKHDLPPA